jgi:hypothetical protein
MRYEHDCSECVYLGAYEDYDLYVCAGSEVHSDRSVVARWGRAGSYLSLPSRFVHEGPARLSGDLAMVEAVSLARAQGLLT